MALKIVDPTSTSSHSALKDSLSADLCDVFHLCLGILTAADLVKPLPEVQEDLYVQLSKIRAAVGSDVYDNTVSSSST